MKTSPGNSWSRTIPLLAALLAAGCGTMRIDTPPPPPPDEEGYTVEAETTEQMVFWGVEASGVDPQDVTVAGRTRLRVRKALLEKGLRLDDERGDVRVGFTAEAEEFDRSGNYYVFEGRVRGEVRVTGAEDGTADDLVGILDAQARGERKLGEADALVSLSDALGGMVSEQALALAGPIRERVHAATLTTRLSWLKRNFSFDTALAEYVTRFVAVVGRLPGVLDCRLIQQNDKAGTAQFRVVYLRDAFPQGLANALLLQPRLKLNDIQ